MSDEYYMKVFSKNLKKYLDLNGKTQTDIVNDLSFNKATVSSWCLGTRLPRIDKVDALAKYLGVNRSDLLEENKDQENGHPSYYLDEESAERIKAMQSDPKLATVFDATRKVKPQDLDQVLKLIKTYIGEDS